jgi:hypothetical protein
MPQEKITNRYQGTMYGFYKVMAKRYGFCENLRIIKSKYNTDVKDTEIMTLQDKKFVITLYDLFIKNYLYSTNYITDSLITEADNYFTRSTLDYAKAYGILGTQPEIISVRLFVPEDKQVKALKYFTYRLYQNTAVSLLGGKVTVLETFNIKDWFIC